MAGRTSAPPNRHTPHKPSHHPQQSQQRPHNLFHIVANKKPTESHISRSDLIEITEKLAIDAKAGTLKGIGGFAEYEGGYICGLEGSYLANPNSALPPLMRLERRIMDQIVEEEQEE